MRGEAGRHASPCAPPVTAVRRRRARVSSYRPPCQPPAACGCPCPPSAAPCCPCGRPAELIGPGAPGIAPDGAEAWCCPPAAGWAVGRCAGCGGGGGPNPGSREKPCAGPLDACAELPQPGSLETCGRG